MRGEIRDRGNKARNTRERERKKGNEIHGRGRKKGRKRKCGF